MIKMLVSSFYNTIIDEEDAIPTSTMFALDTLKKKKIKLTILTNRLSEEVLYYNQDYPFIDYIISLNGSIIYDVKKNKWMKLHAFTKTELKKISQEFVDKEIWYYTQNEVWNMIPQEAVYKIEVQGVKEWKNDQYYTSFLKRNQKTYLEIGKNNPYDAVKKLKIDENEIIGIVGNDSEEWIVKNIPKTYVVRNASSYLKNQAQNLTMSNKSKGVEAVIKKEL